MKIIGEIPGPINRYLVEATETELARLEGFEKTFDRECAGRAPFDVGAEIAIDALYKCIVTMREMLVTLKDLPVVLRRVATELETSAPEWTVPERPNP